MNEVFEVRPTSSAEAEAPAGADTGTGSPDEYQAIADPVDFLVQTAKAHQVVFVGDQRGVSQHLAVIRDSIGPLHEAGVSSLTWEFTHTRRQDELDQLTQSPAWNRALAIALFVDLMGIGHGYEEYVEIVHEVWKRNSERPEGWPPFRLIAAGLPTLVEDPDLLDGRSAAESELRNWWMGGHYRDVSAVHMANIVTNEVIRHGERTVVYADEPRTHTRYVDFDGETPVITPARLLRNWVGAGVARIVFHGATTDVDAMVRVEELVAASPESISSFGIDLDRSTLGNVSVRGLDGVIGAQRGPFDIGDLADGYLFVVPRSEWVPAELIPDLLGPQTTAAAERRYRALDPRPEPYGADELEAVRAEGWTSMQEAWPIAPVEADEEEDNPRRRFRRRR